MLPPKLFMITFTSRLPDFCSGRGNITGWIVQESRARAGRRPLLMWGIRQVRRLHPTFIQWGADNIVKEELLDFPYPVFFHVFVFPDSASD